MRRDGEKPGKGWLSQRVVEVTYTVEFSRAGRHVWLQELEGKLVKKQDMCTFPEKVLVCPAHIEKLGKTIHGKRIDVPTVLEKIIVDLSI